MEGKIISEKESTIFINGMKPDRLKKNGYTRKKNKNLSNNEKIKFHDINATSENQKLASINLVMKLNNLNSCSKDQMPSSKSVPASPEMNELHDHLKKILFKNIQMIPKAAKHLQDLTILNLSNSELQSLPDLSILKNLEKLDLSFNQLTDLPVSFGKLQKLKELNMCGNQFMQIPKCIEYGMGTLRILDVSQNIHMKMNIRPYSRYLEKFSANQNGVSKIFPDWLLSQRYFALKEINLDYTDYDVFSFEGQEGDLRIVKFSMNSSNLSNSIFEKMLARMPDLEVIDVGNGVMSKTRNVFSNIPIKEFRAPENIKELNFRETGLPLLPVEINKLINLSKLDIGSNNISWLPDEFCELINLEYLSIDSNDLILFPDNIGNLKNLKELNSSHNCLGRLPESFQNLKNLEMLDLYDNLIQEFPDVIHKIVNLKGIDLERNYFNTEQLEVTGNKYLDLRRTFILTKNNDFAVLNRTIEAKCLSHHSENSEESSNSPQSLSKYSSDESVLIEDLVIDNEKTDDSWDEKKDSDDEFEPYNVENEINYNYSSRLARFAKSQGFCPADLHSREIKAKVILMRKYGSLPTFEIEQGQFDDA